MNKFGKGSEGNFLDMTEALKFGVGMGEVDYQRYNVTDYIEHLIAGCYPFGFNPLPILRKALPEFEWQFHTLFTKKNPKMATRDRVMKSDFFWFPDMLCWDELVTARRVEKDEKPLMIIGHPFAALEKVGRKDVVEMLRSWGVTEDRQERHAD